MKLQAVVEQLQKQRQQQQQQPAVPMDCRERRREPQVPFPTPPPFPGQPRAGRAPGVSPAVPPGVSPSVPAGRAPAVGSRPLEQSGGNSEDEEEDEEEEDEEEDEEDGAELEDGSGVAGRRSCPALPYFRAPKGAHGKARGGSAGSPVPGAQQGREEQGTDPAQRCAAPGRPGWRLDEQLKQNGGVSWSDDSDGGRGREISRDFAKLYELDSDPERKEFLDDLFIFMQKRGTPINRIPIMAKQILDLYMLYKLVTEKGGLVEIINKKIWREITKGLNLPTSITSAAFTLRTQYMKYLYAYECEKKSLSSPAELQAAIDGNRREGRRPSYSSSLFSYSPSPPGAPSLLSPPKIRFPIIGVAPGGTTGNPRVSPALRKGDGVPLTVSMPSRVAVPVTLGGQQGTVAARTATLEQLRERLEAGEPPEKKVPRMTEEEQRLVQQALQRNLFSMARQIPMKIKINGKDKADAAALNLSPNGIGSINMSVEINGTTYAGVLFAQKPVVQLLASSGTQSSCSSSSSSSSSSSHCSPSPTSSRGTPGAEPSTSWSL
ncbi:AT-rich interactive domain-containing protein 3B [Onychostruthus taczanowskii]|uniref:AT-rich interactive domain-containing protein 3B n=1 Tax=Onychostruthus taczanowskii TaxID=356909 RepID=UPI001B806F5A|nr:AT-rich interactive domain-containing protein 3B [Onychostruthus taczanowskii]